MIETSVMKELKPLLVITVLLIVAGKIKTRSKVSAVQNITISKSLIVELHSMVVSPLLRSNLQHLQCLTIITLV